MIFYQRIYTWSHKHPVLVTFLFGACVGFIASAAYWVSGGDTLVSVSGWARVFFYPGFHAGALVYSVFGSPGAVIIDILVIGLFYGLIALGLRKVLKASRKQL